MSTLQKLLLEAVWRGRHEEVRALLAAGADPNATDAQGSPLLHLLVGGAYCEARTLEALLEGGADPLRRDAEGRTALELCPRDAHITCTIDEMAYHAEGFARLEAATREAQARRGLT